MAPVGRCDCGTMTGDHLPDCPGHPAPPVNLPEIRGVSNVDVHLSRTRDGTTWRARVDWTESQDGELVHMRRYTPPGSAARALRDAARILNDNGVATYPVVDALVPDDARPAAEARWNDWCEQCGRRHDEGRHVLRVALRLRFLELLRSRHGGRRWTNHELVETLVALDAIADVLDVA